VSARPPSGPTRPASTASGTPRPNTIPSRRFRWSRTGPRRPTSGPGSPPHSPEARWSWPSRPGTCRPTATADSSSGWGRRSAHTTSAAFRSTSSGSHPARASGEVVESLRHIWEAFEENRERLDYEGEFYEFSLLTDTFNPGPIDNPDIPVYIAAVNEYNTRMAGEICDGIALHSFNTPSYTREVVQPRLQKGADHAGRSLDEVSISASPFVVTGRDEAERERQRQEVRQRVAFYASTPTYKDVMAHHDWVDTGRELHELSKEGKWEEMAGLVTDEMMDAFAVEAHPDELADALTETYGDLADRVSLALDLEDPALAEQVLDGF
jgi:Coenzyme F420-dependent N5,N10-methylene tetrahydromethanopterin reductase and related flavin-dependent oxidoreductases